MRNSLTGALLSLLVAAAPLAAQSTSSSPTMQSAELLGEMKEYVRRDAPGARFVAGDNMMRRRGEISRHDLSVVAGRTYAIVATCSDECTHLVVAFGTADGRRELSRSIYDDRVAGSQMVARFTGQVIIQTELRGCRAASCAVAYEVYEAPPGVRILNSETEIR